VKQFLISVDQTLNTVVLIQGDGFGYADETLSARLFRLCLQDVLTDRWYKAVDALFFWQTAHCFNSWRAEIERRQLPNHYAGLD
jgi:hypothetical protein